MSERNPISERVVVVLKYLLVKYSRWKEKDGLYDGL